MSVMRKIYIVTRKFYTPAQVTHRFEVAAYAESEAIEAVKNYLNIPRDGGQYSVRPKLKNSFSATILVA